MKILTCLLLLLSSCCLAQTFTFNQGGPSSKHYYEEIPYEDINGKIFVDGEIAGKKHHFLFDTGAPMMISKELADELNAKVLKKMRIVDAFLHTDSTAVIELNNLKLGGLSFGQLPATVGLPDFFKCYQVDGVIGSNLLRNSIVSIVPGRHVIILTDQKDKLSLNSANSRPLLTNIGVQNSPFINILMKGKKSVSVNIEFDTDDKEFMRIEDRFVAAVNQYTVFDTLAKGHGADNLSALGLQESANKYLFKVSPMVIGNASFNNLIVESNKSAQPAIGTKLLEYGTVTLDFIHGKFYFDANQQNVDLGEKQWPFRPTFVNNKLIIGVVYQKEASELTQGDQIMAIDDVDYSHVVFCDLINRRSIVEGKNVITLTLKDAQGNVKKVTVKRDLLD